jgi:predicted RNase H-like HicB family nuclease
MRTLTAIIYPRDTGQWLVAYNPETGTTTQGQMVGQAVANLKEATALYLEEGGKTELIYGLTRLAACGLPVTAKLQVSRLRRGLSGNPRCR